VSRQHAGVHPQGIVLKRIAERAFPEAPAPKGFL